MPLAIEEAAPRQAAVLDLLAQSDAYAASLYPAESNHMVDIDALERPSVSFFVARLQGEVVGCCALVEAHDGTGEIKRMFVDPRARGMNAGRALIGAIEEKARTLGLAAIRLETGIRQPEAINLYSTAGYREIGPFGAYAPDPLSLFMEKPLS